MQSGGHRSWSGAGIVEATPGDVICVNPGEVHDGTSIDGCIRGWQMLYVDAKVVEQAIGTDIRSGVEIARPVIQDTFLARKITLLFNCIAVSRSDSFECEERLILCLASLFDRHGTAKPIVSARSLPVTKSLKRLHEQGAEPASLCELATLSGVSRFQLLRAFTREMGIAPHAYLLQLRVRRAQRLIRNGQTLAGAALRAGFADQSHLTRCFVRQMGITPGRYQAAVR